MRGEHAVRCQLWTYFGKQKQLTPQIPTKNRSRKMSVNSENVLFGKHLMTICSRKALVAVTLLCLMLFVCTYSSVLENAWLLCLLLTFYQRLFWSLIET